MRSEIMSERRIGLTKLYNMLHDPRVKDGDIENLRHVHDRLDMETARAYGWGDLDLEWEFFPGMHGIRRTFPKPIQKEILDRLLEHNHQTHSQLG